jgi:hypothetical protein
MLIVVTKTYRGKHGLYIQGHPYNLPEPLIGQIDAELQMRNPPEKFAYRKVDNPQEVNRPAMKVRFTRPFDGTVKFAAGQVVSMTADKLKAVAAEAKKTKADLAYEIVKEKND